jgi:hypothetical protein
MGISEIASQVSKRGWSSLIKTGDAPIREIKNMTISDIRFSEGQVHDLFAKYPLNRQLRIERDSFARYNGQKATLPSGKTYLIGTKTDASGKLLQTTQAATREEAKKALGANLVSETKLTLDTTINHGSKGRVHVSTPVTILNNKVIVTPKMPKGQDFFDGIAKWLESLGGRHTPVRTPKA